MLRIKNLSHRNPQSTSIALQNINLEIKQSFAIGLLGSNSTGKTTLIPLLTGLQTVQ